MKQINKVKINCWHVVGKTDKVVEAASQIKQQGATGAYTREFDTMKSRVDEVKRLLESSSISSSDLDDLGTMITERKSVNQVNGL